MTSTSTNLPRYRTRHDMKETSLPFKQLEELEVRLTRICVVYSQLDKWRAVRKLVKAQCPSYSFESRWLAPEGVRPWLRQFCGVTLSVAEVGAVVDALPSFLNDSLSDILAHGNRVVLHSLKVDLDMLVLLCRQLRRIDCAMKGAHRKRRKSPLALKRQDKGELRALRALMVKLLAVSLHHEPRAVEMLQIQEFSSRASIANVLQTMFHIDLTKNELVLLSSVLSSDFDHADEDTQVIGMESACLATELKISGKRLKELLYALMHEGLHNRTVLLAFSMCAVRQLNSLGIHNALVENIRALCFHFAKQTLTSRESSNALHDLRVISHTVSEAACKLATATDDAFVGTQAVLGKLCRSYFALLRDGQKSPHHRGRRSSFQKLATTFSSDGTLAVLKATSHTSTLSALRESLRIAHKQRAQRQYLDKMSPVRKGIEQERLETFQEKHLKLAASFYFRPTASPAGFPASTTTKITGSWSEANHRCNDQIFHRAASTSKRIHAMSAALRDKAARTISRSMCSWMCRIVRRRFLSARNEWVHILQQRSREILGRAMRKWLERKKHAERVAALTAKLYRHAEALIYRSLVRYVKRRRERLLRHSREAMRQIAKNAALASEHDRSSAATRAQATWRAIRVRSRNREIQAAREDVRMIRVVVSRGINLLVADSERGSSDPYCYVSAQLGQRGSFAPTGMGPSSVTNSHIKSMYSGRQRRPSLLGPPPIFDEETPPTPVERRDSMEISEAERPFKIYLPSTIRTRDHSKFEQVPPNFPLFSAHTSCVAGSLNPVWKESFIVPGVDPESTIALTVLDRDDVGKDDFLGQSIVRLDSLRQVDARVVRNTSFQFLGKDGGIHAKCGRKEKLMLEECKTLRGEQVVPVLGENGGEQFMDRVRTCDGTDMGSVSVQIWVCPRAYSVCSYLEQRLARNSLVTFWKPSWCCLGFDQLHVYNSRGDQQEPRMKFDVHHIEVVDVLKERDEELMMNFKVAGAGSYIFRVPDIGYPNRDLLLHAWLRRLRRACPRITTNEFAPSEATHDRYNDI